LYGGGLRPTATLGGPALGGVRWYGLLVADEDRASELIRKMNVELLGDSDFQTTQQNLARVWELYNEARAHSSGVQEFRARVDAGMQEFIRRVDALLSTITIGHEVSVSGTVGSLEEARRLLEQGDTSEIIAVALNLLSRYLHQPCSLVRRWARDYQATVRRQRLRGAAESIRREVMAQAGTSAR
jgi:hypothetical protein